MGLRTNISDMRKQGMRPFLVGALGEVAIAALTLGLVLGASKIVKLSGGLPRVWSTLGRGLPRVTVNSTMDADLKKKLQISLLVFVVIAGIRVGFIFYARRDTGGRTEEARDYVFIQHG